MLNYKDSARVRQLYDAATAGNANLDFSCSSDKRNMKLVCGQVVLTTDATVANRRVIVTLLDPSSNTVIDIHAGAVVAASVTDAHHEYMQGVYRETSFIDNAIQIPFPMELIIPKGYTLRVSVQNGVAGDTFSASFLSIEE